MIKVTGEERIRFKLDSLKKGLSAQEYEIIGSEAALDIVERTQKGRDASNRVFAPYKPSTIKNRAKRGRQTARPDLNDKGNMLNSITSEAIQNGAIIQFSKSNESTKAYYHNTGTPNMAQRKFFALSAERVKKIISRVHEYYRGIING